LANARAAAPHRSPNHSKAPAHVPAVFAVNAFAVAPLPKLTAQPVLNRPPPCPVMAKLRVYVVGPLKVRLAAEQYTPPPFPAVAALESNVAGPLNKADALKRYRPPPAGAPLPLNVAAAANVSETPPWESFVVMALLLAYPAAPWKVTASRKVTVWARGEPVGG
jgi:hypothetical protein